MGKGEPVTVSKVHGQESVQDVQQNNVINGVDRTADWVSNSVTYEKRDCIEYLNELLSDMQYLGQTQQKPGHFMHVQNFLISEFNRVWTEVCMANIIPQQQYSMSSNAFVAPAKYEYRVTPELITLEKCLQVPTDRFPNYNFIGRILGPRGMSVKQLEQDTKCRILIKGKGSVRDSVKEQSLCGKHGWDHLSMPLHVSVSASGFDRGTTYATLMKGVFCVQKLLSPCIRDEDKRRQLMQLAIMNGNYKSPLY